MAHRRTITLLFVIVLCGSLLAVASEPTTAEPPAKPSAGLVDWATIAFQVFNFLLLVWLMKKFLYGRIIDAMDERKRKIAEQIAQAEEKEKQAEAEAASFREKTAELEGQKESMLAEAAQEAAAHRKELTEKARAEIEALRTRWRESVDRERTSFLQDLRERATQQTFALARKVLQDLSGKDIDADVVDIFVRHFEQLDEAERKALAEPGDEPDTLAPIVCRTAFDLPASRQKQITALVHENVDQRAAVAFETAPELISGIELKARGHKVAWSADSYLQALEEELDVLLDQGSLHPDESVAPPVEETAEGEEPASPELPRDQGRTAEPSETVDPPASSDEPAEKKDDAHE